MRELPSEVGYYSFFAIVLGIGMLRRFFPCFYSCLILFKLSIFSLLLIFVTGLPTLALFLFFLKSS